MFRANYIMMMMIVKIVLLNGLRRQIIIATVIIIIHGNKCWKLCGALRDKCSLSASFRLEKIGINYGPKDLMKAPVRSRFLSFSLSLYIHFSLSPCPSFVSVCLYFFLGDFF